MKRKYNWDVGLPLSMTTLIIACDTVFLSPLIGLNDIEENLALRYLPIILIMTTVYMLSMIIILQHNVTFLDDVIKVRRPNTKSYSISVNKINRIVVSLNIIPGSKGTRLAIAVDRECGHFIGNGRHMLSAILKIYPNIPVFVMYSGWRLGRKNAILLAQRGYLSEEQLQEVQKRYRLPEGFEKVA